MNLILPNFKPSTPERVVITYGTFDLFHYGHARLLKRASRIGDYLIVALSTDSFNKIKGKKSIQTYKQRKEVLESIKYIDKIIPEKDWKQKAKDIKKYNATFVMGSDWKGKFDELKKYCKVIYLPRTKGISSTLLKSGL